MADVGTNTSERDTFNLEENNQLVTKGCVNLTWYNTLDMFSGCVILLWVVTILFSPILFVNSFLIAPSVFSNVYSYESDFMQGTKQIHPFYFPIWFPFTK
jgi:hypothetical protein